MNIDSIRSSDPKVLASNFSEMLETLIVQVRKDSNVVEEPKAQVLFETSAEVLSGLRTALQHYATGAEKAMR